MSIRKNEGKSYSHMSQEKANGHHTMQKRCRQCGICCTKGGAALHSDDLGLLLEGKIPLSDCVTIRKGEFAWSPLHDKVEAIQTDIVKLRGTGGEWVCCYFNASAKNCGIYANRPIACRTLKCWQPEESLALIGKDLLSRQSIVKNDTVLLDLIEEYEQNFPLPDFSSLSAELLKNPDQTIQHLEELVAQDLAFRDKQVRLSAKVSAGELFLFGRPLFQLLEPFGLSVFQKGNRLCLNLS